METFAQRLKATRNGMGLTQAELATGIGMDTSTIISYEKARTVPKLPAARRLAAYLGVTVDWLCGVEADEPELIHVPLYRIPSPGTPLLRETNQEGTVAVDVRLGISQCLLVKDNSMAGAGIRKGEPVCFRRQEVVETGDIAVVDVKGKGVLIRRVVLEEEGKLRLLAEREADGREGSLRGGLARLAEDELVFERVRNGKPAGCRVIGKVALPNQTPHFRPNCIRSVFQNVR